MNSQFSGTGIALVTPFDKAGQIDFTALERVIDHVIAGGVEYVVSLGTTGETPTLSAEEQAEVLRFTIKHVNKRVPVVAGFGGNNTAQIVRSIENTNFEGIDAILSSSPNYNKPTQEGIFQHYMAIEAVAPRPIILYNVPSRTGRNMKAQTTLKLAHESRKFVAVKEASGNLQQCMRIQLEKPAHFQLLSGDDALTLPMLGIGASGVISVIGNALPRQFSDMVRAALQHDLPRAQNLHYQLFEMMNLIFKDGNPAGVKGALQLLGVTTKNVRLPLVPLTKPTYDSIKLELDKLGML